VVFPSSLQEGATVATDITNRSGDRLASGRSPLVLGFERDRLKLAILLQKNFHLALSLFEFLATRRRKFHPFFKQGQRLFQWGIALLQFLNNLLQALEALFKFWQRDELLRLL